MFSITPTLSGKLGGADEIPAAKDPGDGEPRFVS
jgi:hypothetical protein